MATETSFLMKKLEKMEKVFILFSQATKLPYVECDEETYDDQVFIFTDADKTQQFAKAYTEKKITLAAGQIPGSQLKGLLMNLYTLGVNAVQLDDGEPMHVQLSDLVPEPDIDAMKNEKIVKANPEVQLTSLYFLQELRRPVERTQEEKVHLREMEEEMAVNMFRSKFIVAADISEITDDMTQEEKNQKLKIPYIKTQNGDIYQPVFTDMGECQKFYKRNQEKAKLRLTMVSYDDLPKFLLKSSKGFSFNPAGYNLLLTKEQLELMKNNYA